MSLHEPGTKSARVRKTGMQREMAALIICPSCGAADLDLEVLKEEAGEIREGSLACAACGREYAVRKGVVDLFIDPSPAALRERGAWESMRPEMIADEEERLRSRAWLRALPMLEGKEGPRLEMETWRRHGRAVFGLCAGEEWRGRRVLELGAGRCWLSAHLARKGADVLAVDILDDEEIGLGCAESFLEEGIHFERVICDMHRLPFKAGTFDAVVATATLHHSPEPLTLFEEIRRVIAPGGLLIAANEPLYVPWRETPEEERKGAHEGTYTLWGWLAHLRRADFKVSEVRVGRDASIHIKASPGGAGTLEPPSELAPAAAAYAVILALAFPRLIVRVARRMKTGRPMLPMPLDPMGYLMARTGLRDVAGEVRASDETNWGPGWYRPEGKEVPFRWSGPRARLLLAPPHEVSTLVMELATFHPSPQSSPVHVEVRVGRERLGDAIINRHGWKRYEFASPRTGGRRTVPLTLRVKHGFFVPREMGLGDDDRVLGVACRYARWST